MSVEHTLEVAGDQPVDSRKPSGRSYSPRLVAPETKTSKDSKDQKPGKVAKATGGNDVGQTASDRSMARLLRTVVILALATTASIIATFVAGSMAMSKRVTLIGATADLRFIPAVALNEAYINEPRVQAFVEECMAESFSHDFQNYRRTVTNALRCYTPDAAKKYVVNMQPLLDDIRTRRMVMSMSFQRPPVVTKVLMLNGVYTWDLVAQVSLSRDGTRERVAPMVYDLTIRVSRVALDESVRGVLITGMLFSPA